jgi:hypothetical protein
MVNLLVKIKGLTKVMWSGKNKTKYKDTNSKQYNDPMSKLFDKFENRFISLICLINKDPSVCYRVNGFEL